MTDKPRPAAEAPAAAPGDESEVVVAAEELETAAKEENMTPLEVRVLAAEDLDHDALRAAVARGPVAVPALDELEALLSNPDWSGLLFDEHRSGAGAGTVVIPEVQGSVWFVGDLHGDRLGLEAALQHIRRSEEDAPRVIFLGDLFDDGPDGDAVLLRLFELIAADDWHVGMVLGNHDEALQFEGGSFRSSVDPAEFADWLNRDDRPEWAERLGRSAIGLFERLPRALFFPDGLLVAHGGVPHTDLHEALRDTGDWEDPAVLEDFVWTRAHGRSRRKLPNRTRRGCQFGRLDFADFAALATDLGRPVRAMLRGHDHVEDRYEIHDRHAPVPVVTINTLSHRLARESWGPFARVPCVARWRAGEPLEIHRLRLPETLVEELAPAPAERAAKVEETELDESPAVEESVV